MSLTTTALRTAGTQDLSRLGWCPACRDESASAHPHRVRRVAVGESVVRARDLIDPHRHR
jgi:hypothetical protein